MSELIESLKQSAVNRAMLEQRYGFVPLSILRIHRGALSKKMFTYAQEHPERRVNKPSGASERREKLRVAGYKDYRAIPTSQMAGRGTLGASIMPAELVDFFIKFYAKPGDVYLDPFMGQGVQMQVAKLSGLHYYGYDLSEEFFAYIEGVKGKIDDGKTTISITCGDSRHPDNIPDNIGDFSFHSPPYWDIEYYGDEPAQLGRGSYEEFLHSMGQVAQAWLPKFKSGAWHVVNVNDFRKDGVFYGYHADTVQVFKQAGWQLADTWIIDGLVGGMSKAFAVSFNFKRIAPKVHEYALVFKRP